MPGSKPFRGSIMIKSVSKRNRVGGQPSISIATRELRINPAKAGEGKLLGLAKNAFLEHPLIAPLLTVKPLKEKGFADFHIRLSHSAPSRDFQPVHALHATDGDGNAWMMSFREPKNGVSVVGDPMKLAVQKAPAKRGALP